MGNYHLEVKNIDGQITRLYLSGMLTAENVDEIKSEILQIKSTFSSSLDVVIKEVMDFDLSFLQMLKSLLAFLKQDSIDVSLNWNVEDEQMKLICGAGFSKYL